MNSPFASFQAVISDVNALFFYTLLHATRVSHYAPSLLMSSPRSAAKLRKTGVFSRVDDSNTSIGKRYARNDELGTPYGITIDFACTLSLVNLVF
jgi:hypothetical protein